MAEYFLQIIIFCVFYVNCEDYSEINNSISGESDENPDINEVLDSAEYLDTRDDEFERNNTEFNKSNPEISSDIEWKFKKAVADSPVGNKLESIEESSANKDVHHNDSVLPCKNTKTKKEEVKIQEKSCKNDTVVNFPYVVSIQRKGSHYATGALLNTQTVLTAAAEFYNVRESIKLYRVRLGSVNCKKGGVLLPIKSITIHPQFMLGTPSFDIAVIKLSSPVTLTENVRPIQLSNVTQKVISAKFMSIYWPRLIIQGRSLPKTAKERVKHQSMRISTQRMIPWKSCYSFMEAADLELDPVSLCLKPIVIHHSLCTPDTGAPVVASDVLWGITSGWTSDRCKSQPSPTIITRVSLKPVRKWILGLL